MTLGNDNGTDGQTDRQSATQYAAPSQGGGPHNNLRHIHGYCLKGLRHLTQYAFISSRGRVLVRIQLTANL